MQKIIILVLFLLISTSAHLIADDTVSLDQTTSTDLEYTGPKSFPTSQSCADVDMPLESYCCKVCTTGNARGNSCISRNYTCLKGGGCPWDG